jgi:hypothetical protein
MSSNRETDWDTSAKGNLWRRQDGTPLIVGMSKYGRIWARVDDDFIDGRGRLIRRSTSRLREGVRIMILTGTVAINENARREQSVDTNANTPKFHPNKQAKAVIALLAVWGLIPADFATRLIQRGGLLHE